jgi:hypothetical protein
LRFLASSSRVLLLLAPIACTGSIAGPDGGDDGDDDDLTVDPAATLRVCAGASFTTIGAAIAAAPDGAVIEVCAGTYGERLVVDAKALRLRGDGAATTILDAGGGGTALVIGGGAEVAVEGFTIQHGEAAVGGGVQCTSSVLGLERTVIAASRAASSGGGLQADGCVVQIVDSRFEGNEGNEAGGGALLVDSTGTITGTRFLGNSADTGGGLAIVDGAIAMRRSELRDNVGRVRGGAIYQGSDGVIEDCAIHDNHAGWTGGGIHVHRHAPIVRDSVIAGNTAVEEGGGVYLHESAAQVLDSEITDNSAGDDGGGLRLFTSSARLERNLVARNQAGANGGGVKSSHLPSELVDNSFVDNVAGDAGGALELDNDASVVRGGVIAGNQASRGGGVHAALFPWSGGTIEDVAIVGNAATHGGGVYLEWNYQPITLRGVTIEGNTANRGAGLYVRATGFRLHNSLLAGNLAGDDGGGIYVTAPTPWLDPCPCPPTGGAMDVDFVVLHANDADLGSAVWIDQPGLSLQGSILDGNTGVAVAVQGGAAPTWRYNDTRPASFAGMVDPTGGDGNLAVAPQFVDPAAGDFRLQGESQCIDAGDPAFQDSDGSRADMGLFAGPESP